MSDFAVPSSVTSGEAISALARHILHVLDNAASCLPITDDDPQFDLARAYAVAAAVRSHRIARGERPVGWKIGFTNRTIWDEYRVRAPIYGPVYDTTVKDVATPEVAQCFVGSLTEPRIEPEIVLRLAAPVQAGLSEEELLDAIDGVALGFELVRSPFPSWRFQASDTIAACALHGLLFHRPFVAIDAEDRAAWRTRLSDFALTLLRNGEPIDTGHAANVMGGPLSALKALVDGLPETALVSDIGPGAIITTGTLTRAFPIASGETWSTRVSGLPLADMTIETV